MIKMSKINCVSNCAFVISLGYVCPAVIPALTLRQSSPHLCLNRRNGSSVNMLPPP